MSLHFYDSSIKRSSKNDVRNTITKYINLACNEHGCVCVEYSLHSTYKIRNPIQFNILIDYNNVSYPQSFSLLFFNPIFSCLPVAPTVKVPNQLLGAPLGTDVKLKCYVEAYPNTINYWIKNRGEMLLDG